MVASLDRHTVSSAAVHRVAITQMRMHPPAKDYRLRALL
jgi:metal-dependent HD superfamily phosphatase/phosphodiesterase